MAKRFKMKLSRVIPSLQFCRSKHPSTIPETPLPAIYRLSPVNPEADDISFLNLPAPPPSTPEHSFIKRHVSSKLKSTCCGCRSKSCTHYPSSDWSTESPDYKWVKEAKRHVVSRPYETKPQYRFQSVSFSGESNGDMSPVLVNQNKIKKTKASVSSADSGWFSSEGEESQETETLISTSRSFDSSCEFDHSLDSITEEYSNEEVKSRKKKISNAKKIRRLRRYASAKWKGSNNISKKKTVPSPETESPASVRRSVFRRMIPCTVDGKVRESVAVVKKSKDPYQDFKRSMLEMILEKQMFGAKDLEQLLQCFLSLNSKNYHGIIVEAFSEIWEVMFCDSPVKQ